MNYFKVTKKQSGGGGGSDNVLFKDGTFYNQDIIKVGLNDGQISGGNLVFNGLHAGFLLEELNLPSGATGYDIYFKTNCILGENTQCGTCSPNLTASTDLYNIIHYGTGRITYNNDSLTANTNYWFRLIPAASASNAVFFGDGNAYEGDAKPFTIEEMYFDIYDGIIMNRS